VKDFETQNLLALQSLEKGQYQQALNQIDLAIQLAPLAAQAHDNRGIILQRMGLLDEALTSHNEAIQANPNLAKAYNNRATVYFALGQLDLALIDIQRAIHLQPDLSESHCNLANVYHRQGRYEQALEAYDKALSLNPSNQTALSSRGNTLKELGQFNESMASHTRAMQIAPHQQDIRYNASHLLLLLGHLKEGFYLYEDRLKNKVFAQFEKRHNDLTLEKLANKTVLVEWEQGIGDNFQFCRYLPLLAKMNAQVMFMAPKKMHKLFSSLGPEIQLVDQTPTDILYDEHLPLLSLPRIFKTELNSIPYQNPYLFVAAAKVKEWQQRLGDHGFKIGICWQGSTVYKDDHVRSFAVSHFKEIGSIPDVRLISLHKGVGEIQLKTLPEGMVVEAFDDNFLAAEDAFVDLAGIIMNLDLVITCDTSIAHLAGALGVPTWIALKKVPDWRWMLDREDSPWYPNLRVFRQVQAGDWTSIFEEFKQQIRQLKSHE